MDESPDRIAEVMCTGCGRLNPEGIHFCPDCGAPLTNHATTDPLGSVFAEGYAARRALSQPSKPIIVIGIWAWMLPMAFFSLGGLAVAIVSIADGVFTFQWDSVFIMLLAALICLVVFYIACTLLYRVTRRANDASQPGKPESTASANNSTTQVPEADAEPFACLKCNQSIPVGTTQCPACGWSYSDESETKPAADN